MEERREECERKARRTPEELGRVLAETFYVSTTTMILRSSSVFLALRRRIHLRRKTVWIKSVFPVSQIESDFLIESDLVSFSSGSELNLLSLIILLLFSLIHFINLSSYQRIISKIYL